MPDHISTPPAPTPTQEPPKQFTGERVETNRAWLDEISGAEELAFFATWLYLLPSVNKKLGLARTDTMRSQTTNGEAIVYKYKPVELELLERRGTFDVIEVPENVPDLLGKVPLDILGFVVDPKTQRLIPNPAHGGEQMTEDY